MKTKLFLMTIAALGTGSIGCLGGDVRLKSQTTTSASPSPAASGDPSGDSGNSNVVTPPPVAQQGSIALTLTADGGALSSTVVSIGVPFPPGALTNADEVALFNASGTEVAIQTQALARWPEDGSVRSLLLVFRATLASAAIASYRIDYGVSRGTTPLTGLSANPDGPGVATLPASWYGSSLVSGRLLASAENSRFAGYDSTLVNGMTRFNLDAFVVGCSGTHRTYYDGPHANYQFFLRKATAAQFRRARKEAVWYRANELRWPTDRAWAAHVCLGSSWTPTTSAMDWGSVRRLAAQGMLDDYLLTGDPAAREALAGIGEGIRLNLPKMTSGSEIMIEVTERNMAWPLMGLGSYYAIDQRELVRAALVSVVERAIAWQARGTTGAFEHDIRRPDPSECDRGPKGGSPFMTSLLVDGLMDYQQLTKDSRVPSLVRKIAEWYRDDAITSDGQAFRYLWNCETNTYDSSSTADLNIMIAHVFGAAYAMTGDRDWIVLGDRLADAGVDAMYAAAPKQWNQSARSFGKYLGYRGL